MISLKIKTLFAFHKKTETQNFTTENLVAKNGRGGHNKVEYYTTLKMAKELSMVERNEKGKQARKYFIACEEQLKAKQLPPQPQPPRTYSEALRELADSWDREQALLEQNKVMTPKAEYFDELVSRNLLTILEIPLKSLVGNKKRSSNIYYQTNIFTETSVVNYVRMHSTHRVCLK